MLTLKKKEDPIAEDTPYLSHKHEEIKWIKLTWIIHLY